MSRYGAVVGTLFGGSVRTMRESRGWTQRDLAERMSEFLQADVKELTVTRIENAQRPVPIEEACALAQILDISIDALHSGRAPQAAVVKGYLVSFANGASSNTFIEDPGLALDFHHQCAVISDKAGVVLAVPVEQVGYIQRVDEDQGPEPLEPAPQKE